MPDEKPPVEKAVELLVYAPVGMALYVRDMLPEHDGNLRRARQARGAVAPHPAAAGVTAAGPARGEAPHRRLGRHGPRDGRRWLRGRARRGGQRHRRRPRRRRQRAHAVPRVRGANGERHGPAPRAAPHRAPRRRRRSSCPPTSRRSRPTRRGRPTSPPSDSLPIPDYDELSASQVVERLDGLDRDSLEAIRRYEIRPPRPQHDPRQDRAAHLTWSRAGRRRSPTSPASSSWPA